MRGFRTTTRDAGGFGFIESMIAMALLSFAVLSTAQMIITGVYVSEASSDLTSVTSLASQQMEALKSVAFDDLDAGGDIDANVNNFFDTIDLDGDGTAEFTRRWEVTDLGLSKTIDVVALGPPTAMGDARQARLTALMVDKE
jgi:Tfp pilus assembly protein PilV